MIDREGLKIICEAGGVSPETQEKLRVYFEGLLTLNAHKLAEFAAGLVSEARRQDVLDKVLAEAPEGRVH